MAISHLFTALGYLDRQQSTVELGLAGFDAATIEDLQAHSPRILPPLTSLIVDGDRTQMLLLHGSETED